LIELPAAETATTPGWKSCDSITVLFAAMFMSGIIVVNGAEAS